MKICLLKETKSFLFHFFHKLITLFHYTPAGKKRAHLPLYALEKTRVSCYNLWEENKSTKKKTYHVCWFNVLMNFDTGSRWLKTYWQPCITLCTIWDCQGVWLVPYLATAPPFHPFAFTPQRVRRIFRYLELQEPLYEPLDQTLQVRQAYENFFWNVFSTTIIPGNEMIITNSTRCYPSRWRSKCTVLSSY